MLPEEGRREDIAESHLKRSSMELSFFTVCLQSVALCYFSCTVHTMNQENSLAFPQCRVPVLPEASYTC